jgi:hypothetical protein
VAFHCALAWEHATVNPSRLVRVSVDATSLVSGRSAGTVGLEDSCAALPAASDASQPPWERNRLSIER